MFNNIRFNFIYFLWFSLEVHIHICTNRRTSTIGTVLLPFWRRSDYSSDTNLPGILELKYNSSWNKYKKYFRVFFMCSELYLCINILSFLNFIIFYLINVLNKYCYITYNNEIFNEFCRIFFNYNQFNFLKIIILSMPFK